MKTKRKKKTKVIEKFSIENPADKWFSDIRLKKCFSKKVILILGELYEKEERFHKYYKLLENKLLRIGISEAELDNLYQEILHQKVPCCKSLIEYNGVKKNCRDLIKQRFYKKEKCFFCNKKIALEIGHLIKKAILKDNKKTRKPNHRFRNKREKKYYEVFINNIANIVYVCGHHHNLLDGRGGRLPNWLIKRLIGNRKNLNKKIIKIAEKETKKYDLVTKKLQKFEDNLTNFILSKYEQEIKKIKNYSI